LEIKVQGLGFFTICKTRIIEFSWGGGAISFRRFSQRLCHWFCASGFCLRETVDRMASQWEA